MDMELEFLSQADLDLKQAYLFPFSEDRLLVKSEDGAFNILEGPDFETLLLTPLLHHYLGLLHRHKCYALDLEGAFPEIKGYAALDLRELFGNVSDDLFSLAAHAFQIVNWDRMHNYCGKCGTRTDYASKERAKVCPSCAAVYYPRITPAIIVAVSKGDRLLLLRNKHQKRFFYSVLAGFVEAGESLEECLIREVREEAGIEVKNISYFASQPWPFPNTLMIGFTADYASGELNLDQSEISAGGWFRPEEFPPIPGLISIARRLIDDFVEKQKRAG